MLLQEAISVTQYYSSCGYSLYVCICTEKRDIQVPYQHDKWPFSTNYKKQGQNQALFYCWTHESTQVRTHCDFCWTSTRTLVHLTRTRTHPGFWAHTGGLELWPDERNWILALWTRTHYTRLTNLDLLQYGTSQVLTLFV